MSKELKKQLIQAIIKNKRLEFYKRIKEIKDIQFDQNLATIVAMQYGRLEFLKVLVEQYNTNPLDHHGIGLKLCNQRVSNYVKERNNTETNVMTQEDLEEQVTINRNNIKNFRDFLKKKNIKQIKERIADHEITLNEIVNRSIVHEITLKQVKGNITEHGIILNKLKKPFNAIKNNMARLIKIERVQKEIKTDNEHIVELVRNLVNTYQKEQVLVKDFENRWLKTVKKTIDQESSKLKKSIKDSRASSERKIEEKFKTIDKKNKKKTDLFFKGVQKGLNEKIKRAVDQKMSDLKNEMGEIYEKVERIEEKTTDIEDRMVQQFKAWTVQFKIWTVRLEALQERTKSGENDIERKLERINRKLGLLTEYSLIEHLKRIIEKKCGKTFQIRHSYDIPLEGDVYFDSSQKKYSKKYLDRFEDVFGREKRKKMTPITSLEIDYVFHKEKKGVLSIIEITTRHFGSIRNEKILQYPEEIEKNLGMRKFIDKLIQIERILHFLIDQKSLCRVYLITIGGVFGYKTDQIKGFMRKNKKLFPNIYALYTLKKFNILSRSDLKY